MMRGEILEAAVWLAAGAVLSAAYLEMIRRTVRGLAPGGSRRSAAAFLALRVAAAAGFFWAAAQQGAPQLLAGLLGFAAARAALLRFGKAD